MLAKVPLLLNGTNLTTLVEIVGVSVPWKELRISGESLPASFHLPSSQSRSFQPKRRFDSTPSSLLNDKGSSTHPSPAQPQNMGRVLRRRAKDGRPRGMLQKQVPVSFLPLHFSAFYDKARMLKKNKNKLQSVPLRH